MNKIFCLDKLLRAMTGVVAAFILGFIVTAEAFGIGTQGMERDLSFRYIGVSNGLPDNYVKSVFPLPDGRVGVRTTVMFNIFNGSSFSSFPIVDSCRYLAYYNSQILRQFVDNQNRVWLQDREGILLFDLKKERYIGQLDTVFRNMGMTRKVKSLMIDSQNRFWLGDGTDYYVYAPGKKLKKIEGRNGSRNASGEVLAVASQGKDTWMLYSTGILRCYDTESNRFIRHSDFLKDKIKTADHVEMHPADNGDLWISYNKTGGYYSTHSDHWEEILSLPDGIRVFFTGLAVDNSGNAWFSTIDDGIYIVNRHDFQAHHIPAIKLSSGTTLRTNIQSMAYDPKTGCMWIGFFNRGLCYYHPSLNRFAFYSPRNLPGIWMDENVHAMLEYNDGTILLGTSHGLHRYNPSTGAVDQPFPNLSWQVVRTLHRDSHDRIWVNNFRDSLLYYISDGSLHGLRLSVDKAFANTSDPMNVRTLAEDSKGRLWVSIGGGGVGLLNPGTGHIDLLKARHPELEPFQLCNAMAMDSRGRLVVGSDNGLYLYNPDTGKVEVASVGGPYLAAGFKFNDIFSDGRGYLWLATQTGLGVVLHSGRYVLVGTPGPLDMQTVQSIQEDNNGDIWVSTINTLHKIEVNGTAEKPVFDVISYPTYGDEEGAYEFTSIKTRSGMLYFGRINGFNAFVPENLAPASNPHTPSLTGFRLFNKEVGIGEKYNGRVLLSNALDYTDEIRLKHNENFITLGFAGLNYATPSQTWFKYMLEGVDKEWVEVRSDNGESQASYSNLPPGDYVFHLFTAEADRKWGQEATLRIHVSYPWWNCPVAWVIYGLLLVALVVFVIRMLTARNARKIKLMQQEEARSRDEELNNLKFKFFTNISHELRTPLTLIITPLDILINKVQDSKLQKQLAGMSRNAHNLLNLVNELLDFRKLEMHGERLHLSGADINEFVCTVCDTFTATAAERGFDFTVDVPTKSHFMYFDKDKLHKILNNLISNAFKFTPSGGRIKVSLTEDLSGDRPCAVISVQDNGKGIPESQLSKIFDRFYQVAQSDNENTGSGIGLHLTAEYARMHNGDIKVHSKECEGSTFSVSIPMDLKGGGTQAKESAAQDNSDADLESGEPAAEETGRDGNLKKILLIEDNVEFRTFLAEQLSETYNVLEASDGEEGERIAIAENPDLIISDIMMPKVDGIELCRRIKTNVQTSHIPVVLLTARTADEVKISSYGVGADCYMSKPFNYEILSVRVAKLIEQQESRRREFSRSIEVNPSAITVTSVDEQLLKKALSLIEDNMDNTAYSVEDLSRDLGMTRVSLFRKLKSISGLTPTDFIKSIRLKRAAQLLKGSKLSMSEVADMVGFSSPSYFAKCFKEAFSMSPTQYAEANATEFCVNGEPIA